MIPLQNVILLTIYVVVAGERLLAIHVSHTFTTDFTHPTLGTVTIGGDRIVLWKLKNKYILLSKITNTLGPTGQKVDCAVLGCSNLHVSKTQKIRYHGFI